MEHIITKLLRDFEQGRMTRRQLIQSLVLAATAASAATATPAAEVGGKTLKVIGVNHISSQVPDYTKIRDFYSDLFGMKVSRDDGKQCRLSFGDTHLVPHSQPGDTPRVDHIAYVVENWDKNAAEAELKRRGLQPEPDNDTFYIMDPAGLRVQIGRYLP